VGYAPGVIRGFDFARCGVTQDDFEVEDGTPARSTSAATGSPWSTRRSA
jgi:hypothetical protein